MKITVKFFASLRESLGKQEFQIETDENLSVLEVWQQSTGEPTLPVNVLCAINMEYVDASQRLDNDAEVAFFPPVTGG